MIDTFIDEINRALSYDLYFSALSLALTLPDICGKAEYPDKKSTSRYKLWYDEYIGKSEHPVLEENQGEYSKEIIETIRNMPYLSGEIVYNFRCSLFHQGTPNIDRVEYQRRNNKKCPIDKFVVVTEQEKPFQIYGGERSSVVTDNDGNQTRTYRVNIRRLCKILTLTAKKYYEENKEKFHFLDYSILDWDNEMEKMRILMHMGDTND